MQRYLDGLSRCMTHHGFKSLAEPVRERRDADKNPGCHPVVNHPETGKRVFCEQLIHHPYRGLPRWSQWVLQFLWRHASLPEFTCRFSWQPNSMVLWDNRSTQHKPVNDFFPATRKLHRVVSEGDQPY